MHKVKKNSKLVSTRCIDQAKLSERVNKADYVYKSQKLKNSKRNMLEFGNIDKRLRSLAQRFNAVLVRGVVSNFKNSNTPIIQAKMKSGVAQNDIPFWQNAGMSSNPKIGDDSDTLITALDGDASKRIAIICTGSAKYRLDANDGELVLYDTANESDQKNFIKIKPNGIEICLGNGNLDIKDNSGNALSPIARVGDTVQVAVTSGSSAGVYTGTITTGSAISNTV